MIRLGTRRSALATAQATWVAGQLRALGHEVELVPIVTTGDVSGQVIDSFSLGRDAVTLLQVRLGFNGPIPAQIKLLIEGKECAPQW